MLVCSEVRCWLYMFVNIGNKMAKTKKRLTLYEKSRIMEDYKKGLSVTILAKKYGVSESTICSINRKQNKIMPVVSQSMMPSKIQKRTLRNAENPRMETALNKWFIQQRERNLSISGDLLKQKAIQLHVNMNFNLSKFNASDGWLQKFKKRYGVRLLKICGEKLSSQPELVDPFKQELTRTIQEFDLNEHQIYNADETGLFWKLLPYALLSEKTAPGLELAKQRITFLGCTNATDLHKLTPFVIGKAKSPRALKNFNNPVVYTNSKSAWMTKDFFKSWFFKLFIPEMETFLRSINLPEKAILLLDNAPSHPPAEELKSNDGAIFVTFMPPNVTPIIQPLDQNVLRLTKLYYKKSLLSYIISKGEGVADAIKTLTWRDAILHLYSAWNELHPLVISKCWHNILGRNTFEQEDNLTLARVQEIWNTERADVCTIRETTDLLQEVHQTEYSNKDVEEWNNDVIENYTDLGGDGNNFSDVSDCEYLSTHHKKITHADVLQVVTQWAEENEVTVSDIVSLRHIQEKAVLANISVKKVQTKLKSYFPKCKNLLNIMM